MKEKNNGPSNLQHEENVSSSPSLLATESTAQKQKGGLSHTLVSLFILLVILVALVWFIGIENLINAAYFVQKNPFPIFAFFFFFTAGFFFRALRWKVILQQKTSSWILFRIALVAWFINGITPARLGDAASIYLFGKEADVRYSKGTTLVILDRILDILALIVIFAFLLSFVVVDAKLGNVGLFFLIFSLLLAFFALTFLLILAYYPRFFTKVNDIILGNVNSALAKKIDALIYQFHNEVISLGKNKTALVLAFLLAFPTWIFESTSVFLVAQTLNIKVSFSNAVLSVLFGFFSMTLPFTIGGFGTFEVAIATTLFLLTAIPYDKALLIAFLDHVVRQVYVVVVGGLALYSFSESIHSLITHSRELRTRLKKS